MQCIHHGVSLSMKVSVWPLRPTAVFMRNNIMVALTDLTVQYTALVDAQVPRLAACLADPHELVRRQTLALLASLLSRVRHHLETIHQTLQSRIGGQIYGF